MQRNRGLLREIENTNQPFFIPADVLRAHKGIAQQIKIKARNQNATEIDSAMNSMRDTLYNLIRNNRNNTTEKYLQELLNTFLNLEQCLMIEIQLILQLE